MFHSARWDHASRSTARASASSGPARPAVQIVVGRRRPGRAPVAVPAHRAVDHAAGEPGVHRRAEGGVPSASPSSCAEMHAHLARDVRHVRERGRRRRLAADQDDRGACASRTSRAACATRSCASGCAPTTAPRASVSSSRPTSTTRSSSPTPSSSPRRSSGSSRAACAPSDGALHELDVLVLATGFKANAFMRPMHGHRARRRDPRRGVGRATERVPVDLDPRVPELLHAQRAERTRRQLLAHRGRRAAVRRTSCSSSSGSDRGECREISATAARDGGVRGRARRSRDRTRSGSPAAAAGTSTTAASPPRGRGRSTGSGRRCTLRTRPRSSIGDRDEAPSPRTTGISPRRGAPRRACRARGWSASP